MGKMGIAALTAEFLTINFGSMAVFTILKEDKTKYWFNICYLLTLPAKVILNSEICDIFVLCNVFILSAISSNEFDWKTFSVLAKNQFFVKLKCVLKTF